MAEDYDLLMRAGRVFCAATGLDGPGAVAVSGDRIAAAGPDVAGAARKVMEFPDALLLPGLVDLHAHPAHGGSKYAVDPDVEFLPRGVTTVMSQGDAGAENWQEYQEKSMGGFETRIRMALNLARDGESRQEGCFVDLEMVDAEACAAAIEAHPDGIWGIALNTAASCCGDNDPDEILTRGIRAARGAGVPILFGNRRLEDQGLGAQLAMLRSGDVLTYCLHPDVEGLLNGAGRIRDEVWQARERGILFDSAHGMGSFGFAVAEAAFADGFFPDTISTDQYYRHTGSEPQHDLPRTLSKHIAAGMPEAEAFARSTVVPAQVLGLEGEVGTLAPGACADLAVLHFKEEALSLVDTIGATRPGGCWESVCVVRAGVEVGTA